MKQDLSILSFATWIVKNC